MDSFMEIIKNNLTKVTFNVVNEAPLESLIGNAIFIGKPLCWCNGILFSFEPVMPTELTITKQFQGEMLFASLTWCVKEDFVNQLDDGNNQKIPVLNLNHHSFWKEVLENVR